MEFAPLVDTFFNGGVLRQAAPLLLKGLWLTFLLGVTSIALAAAMGLPLVLLRLYGPVALRGLAVAYIDVFRALPLLVLLVLVYYALPFVGVRLSSFWAATISLSVVGSAYAAEVLRAGIEAVPKGQVEAARALGFPWASMMRNIVLPQALRLVVPPATGIAVSMVKDTALASVVAMPDLLKQATQTQALYANPSPLVGAALLYLALLLPAVRLVSALENRQQRARR